MLENIESTAQATAAILASKLSCQSGLNYDDWRTFQCALPFAQPFLWHRILRTVAHHVLLQRPASRNVPMAVDPSLLVNNSIRCIQDLGYVTPPGCGQQLVELLEAITQTLTRDLIRLCTQMYDGRRGSSQSGPVGQEIPAAMNVRPPQNFQIDLTPMLMVGAPANARNSIITDNMLYQM